MTSIYDFSILPYALGDVLTWNVKQQIKAIDMEDPNIDLKIYDGLVNIHQDKYINENNSRSYMTDLIPAFYTNPMIRSVEIVHGSNLIEQKYNNMISVNKVLFNEVSSHQDINEYFKVNGKIPQLVSPVGFDEKLSALEIDVVPERVVAIHVRSRRTDQSLGDIETHRDCDKGIWVKFLQWAADNFPDVLFVLIGKMEEEHEYLCRNANVIFPRMFGWSLAQELALIPQSSFFIGACSGFAAMAAFTNKPYLITKLDERSFINYGIPFGSTSLPFATEHQKLSNEPESVELLQNHFKRMVKI